MGVKSIVRFGFAPPCSVAFVHFWSAALLLGFYIAHVSSEGIACTLKGNDSCNLRAAVGVERGWETKKSKGCSFCHCPFQNVFSKSFDRTFVLTLYNYANDPYLQLEQGQKSIVVAEVISKVLVRHSPYLLLARHLLVRRHGSFGGKGRVLHRYYVERAA